MTSLNSFDATVYVIAVVAILTGFRAGLLRSIATIAGYLAAMPIAVTATPYVARLLATRANAVPDTASSGLFFVVFLGAGIALGALLRAALNETVGKEIGLLDRLGGAMLGALRVALVAVTLVLVFDRIIPPGRQPAFLVGSKLQPVLLKAGQAGLKSLPGDVTALIDQLKSGRRI